MCSLCNNEGEHVPRKVAHDLSTPILSSKPLTNACQQKFFVNRATYNTLSVEVPVIFPSGRVSSSVEHSRPVCLPIVFQSFPSDARQLRITVHHCVHLRSEILPKLDCYPDAKSIPQAWHYTSRTFGRTVPRLLPQKTGMTVPSCLWQRMELVRGKQVRAVQRGCAPLWWLDVCLVSMAPRSKKPSSLALPRKGKTTTGGAVVRIPSADRSRAAWSGDSDVPG